MTGNFSATEAGDGAKDYLTGMGALAGADQTLTLPRAGAVHENPAHGLGDGGEEVRPVLELETARPAQPQVPPYAVRRSAGVSPARLAPDATPPMQMHIR